MSPPTTEPPDTSRRLWTLAVLWFVALEGATLQMRGAVLPTLREEFAAPAWQLGLVAPADTLGFALVVALVGVVAARFDTRRLFALGIVGTGLGVLAMGVAPSFLVFLAALGARGAMAGVGRGVDRPLLSHLHPRGRGRWFSYYDMVWAVGATLGPLAVALAIRLGDWRLAYYALGLAFLPVAVLVWRLPTPSVAGDEPLTLGAMGRIVRHPTVLVMAAGLFCSTGIEGGLFTWLTTYADGRLAGPLVTVSLSVLLVAYIPGRFVAGRLNERLGYVRVAGLLTLGCLLALGYTLLVATGPWLLVGVFALGLCVSGFYPTFLAYGTEAIPEQSAPLNALGLVTAATGIAAVPVVMGFVIADAGVAVAMRLLFVPGAALLAVVGLAWWRYSA